MKRFWMNAKYWMRRRVDALVIWFPIMTKKQHRAILSRDRQQLNQQHSREMEETRKKVDSILNRVGRIEWRRESDGYAMLLKLNPQAVGAGYCSPEELRYLAEAFAYRVETEIASARFIQSAHQLEHDKFRHRNYV